MRRSLFVQAESFFEPRTVETFTTVARVSVDGGAADFVGKAKWASEIAEAPLENEKQSEKGPKPQTLGTLRSHLLRASFRMKDDRGATGAAARKRN